MFNNQRYITRGVADSVEPFLSVAYVGHDR